MPTTASPWTARRRRTARRIRSCSRSRGRWKSSPRRSERVALSPRGEGREALPAADARDAQRPEDRDALVALVDGALRGAILLGAGELRVARRLDLDLARDGHVVA